MYTSLDRTSLRTGTFCPILRARSILHLLSPSGVVPQSYPTATQDTLDDMFAHLDEEAVNTPPISPQRRIILVPETPEDEESPEELPQPSPLVLPPSVAPLANKRTVLERLLFGEQGERRGRRQVQRRRKRQR